MPGTIQQCVRLAAPANELFDSYLDPGRHAAITGQAVRIAAAPGSEFRAFDGMLSGRIVAVIPKRLIVQTWRAGHWTEKDADSIQDVSKGWEKYYWAPW